MHEERYDIRIVNLVKKFGSTTAVNDFNIEIEKGKLVALLGPSGCGKTTLLRLIAGFEKPTSGDIVLRGKVINDVPPQKRNIGIVFQDYAVFPIMNVFDNVAYGLRIKKLPREEINSRVMEYLALVGLTGYEKRMPSQLSGGQQQRVALARALVTNPDLLLLDEPLSNLDAALRLRIRKEIKKIQRKLGITAIFVTHDQEEALSIADKIYVMRRGILMQGGSPREIYNNPKNDFVANFIGKSNIFYGKVVDADENYYKVGIDGSFFNVSRGKYGVDRDIEIDRDVWVSIRPHFLSVRRNGDSSSVNDNDNRINGNLNRGVARVNYIEYLGSYTKGELKLESGLVMEFELSHSSTEELDVKVDDTVSYSISPENIIVGDTIKGTD